MYNKTITKYLGTIILYGIYGAFIVLFVWRVFLSVELTDEVHGVASIYHIYQGKIPFMTSWDYHTGWCLQVFLLKLFHCLSPDFEGVILFFRIYYIIFSLIMAGVAALLLCDKNSKVSMLIFTLPLSFWIPFSLCQVNYLTFTVYVLILVSTLLYTADKNRVGRIRYFAIGVLMCLGCITYITLVIMAVLLVLWIGFTGSKKTGWKNVFWYVCGGMIAAGIFCFWIFSQGSFSMFIYSLNGMLSSPHEKTKGLINAAFMIKTFYTPFKHYFLRRFTGVIIGYFLFNLIINRKRKKQGNFGKSLFFILFQIVNLYSNYSTIGYMAFGSLLGSILFLAGLKGSERKSYAIYFIVLFSYILTYSFTSDNKNVFAAFESAGALIVFISGLIVKQYIFDECKSIGILISFLLCIMGILHVYTYVYRDEPVTQLTERVTKGIYKGLYTTESRKDFVEELENVLEEQILETDKICTATRAPMVYLMSKSNICAPQTWDAQFLSRGYTSASPLLNYFQAMDELPEVFVATTMDVPDFYDNPKYEINSFIQEYYDLKYEKQIQDIFLYLWRRKDLEEQEIKAN